MVFRISKIHTNADFTFSNNKKLHSNNKEHFSNIFGLTYISKNYKI